MLHDTLFTSGAYVAMFEPEVASNPFASLYAAKRRAVVAAVEGRDRQILDIGGGTGRIAIPLSANHDVVLSDLSPQMLERATPFRGPRLQLTVAHASALPFGDGRFDYALCIDVLPHLATPDVALREARRVLRRGGRLVIDSTNAVPLWTLAYPRYLGRNPLRWARTWSRGGVPPEWQSRTWHYPRSTFLRLLRQAGFRVLSVQGFGPPFCPKWHLAVAEAE